MNSRTIAAITAFTLIAATTLALTIPPAQGEHVEVSKIRWACGSGGGGQTGHPDRCGSNPVGGGKTVSSVGEPRFSQADGAWIRDSDRVLGVIVENDVRAYPVKMLDRHEIVNDVIGGTPVAVTYCPLCGSGISFERTLTINNQATEVAFTASGFLFQNDLVMWDDVTGTLWNQILGRPIATLTNDRIHNHHMDAELTLVPTIITTWSAWKTDHPNTLILEPIFSPASYEGAYAGYDNNCQIGLGGNDCDVDGLHPKTVVYGVETVSGGVAFPVSGLQQAGGVAVLKQHGQTVVAAADAGGGTRAYDGGSHVFVATDAGLWMDQDGELWDLQRGMRTDGSQQLPPLDGLSLYWFAWREHHPETALWLPESGLTNPIRTDNGKLPGFTIVYVLAGLVALTVLARRRWQ